MSLEPYICLHILYFIWNKKVLEWGFTPHPRVNQQNYHLLDVFLSWFWPRYARSKSLPVKHPAGHNFADWSMGLGEISLNLHPKTVKTPQRLFNHGRGESTCNMIMIMYRWAKLALVLVFVAVLFLSILLINMEIIKML